jgi:phosphomevalonate kinase
MIYYLIYSSNGIFQGYINNKKLINKFKQQRNKEDYKIIKLNEKGNKEIINEIKDNENKIIEYEDGLLVFPSEEEYYVQSLNQYILDVKSYINYINNSLRYIKLDKKEKLIIKKCFNKIINLVNVVDGNDDENGDEPLNYDNYLKFNKMMKKIING